MNVLTVLTICTCINTTNQVPSVRVLESFFNVPVNTRTHTHTYITTHTSLHTPLHAIPTTSLRFSPSLRRYIGLLALVLALLGQELNTFFLKAIYGIPASNILNLYRIVIWALIALPTLRQLYSFLTDPTCHRFGAHADIALAMLITEVR